METSSSTHLADTSRPEEQLSELFGSYKAEWLRERLFEFFKEPNYFPELITDRPCVLLGGRGTGKTTVLRSLSYEGQFALHGCDTGSVPAWRYYGLYYRVNTNRVTAFRGPEISDQKWVKLFAHYLNLVLCDRVLSFLLWYRSSSTNFEELGQRACADVATSLHVPVSAGMEELSENVRSGILSFEALINNIADSAHVPLSMQAAPIDALLESVSNLRQFKGKQFFFLLDEYENFENYQQQVVNTLIKHSNPLYTFKIGIKELGWRVRTTLNLNEQLNSPADYVRVNITESLDGDAFKRFASEVCHRRLERLHENGQETVLDVNLAFPGLSPDAEAERLGIETIVSPVRAELLGSFPAENVRALTPLQLLLLITWAETNGTSVTEQFRDWQEDRNSWEERFKNYQHSLLYVIKRGKRGITKYYAGWDVFIQLASKNIRYLLELVDKSLHLHLKEGRKLSDPLSVETQTIAAQIVGKKNLSELEGLAVNGAQLTKLLLGLGRVFQVMAVRAGGHAPEVNQFYLGGEPVSAAMEDEVESLLRSAVMHLALVRNTGSKLTDDADTKDYDYMVHPIFSAFFAFSYRHKRKMLLTNFEFLGLIQSPHETIRQLLARQNRLDDEPLPEQSVLFESYYGHS